MKTMKNSDYDAFNDAEDTLRFVRTDFDDDPTSIMTTAARGSVRRRQIHDTRENILRLRAAITAGWDIAPELAHEEQQLAALEAQP